MTFGKVGSPGAVNAREREAACLTIEAIGVLERGQRQHPHQQTVDQLAEESLAGFLEVRAPRMAWYSEDRGLVAPDDAVDVLVVDPIDGTRPAMAGLESACVAVALAPLGEGNPTMADVEAGCVVEAPRAQTCGTPWKA